MQIPITRLIIYFDHRYKSDQYISTNIRGSDLPRVSKVYWYGCFCGTNDSGNENDSTITPTVPKTLPSVALKVKRAPLHHRSGGTKI